MRRARQLICSVSCVLGTALAVPHRANAGPRDVDALVVVADAMDNFLQAKYDAAIGALEQALTFCKGAQCEPSVRAHLHMALGIIYGAGMKNSAKARGAFENALREDPKTVLDRQWATKEVDKAFTEAKASVKSGAAPARGMGKAMTPSQRNAVASAEAALAEKEWSQCMQTLIAEMATAEFASGKVLLAECENAGGLLLEAANDATLARKLAEDDGQTGLLPKIDALLEKLSGDTPVITLVIPKGITVHEVKIDGVAVPRSKAAGPIPHNPGKAVIEVKGKRGRFPMLFKTTEVIERGEQITVNVDAESAQNSAVMQCILAAKTPADVNLCIETGGKGRGFTFRSGVEVALYADDNETDVVTPSVFVSGENPTTGWQVGGSFLVDVVSTASADIVASASRRWDEVRYAATLGGDHKLGPVKVGVSGGLSVEPDYVAKSFGGSLGIDLANKMVTPSVSYVLSLDELGRRGTPFDVFSEELVRHTIDAGVTVVIDAATIGVLGATVELASGDSSKPYRHVPMFTSGIADSLPRGATVDLVNAQRSEPAPLEQLPTERKRFALLGRVAHRFERMTLRADERLYVDSWGQKASTTDGRLVVDIGEKFRVWPHLRFNIQGPVDFWQRAYVATKTASGWQIPEYRTTDRELGPLFAVTAGGGMQYELTDIFRAGLQLEGMYTQFLDHIYLYDRVGAFSAVTLELEID